MSKYRAYFDRFGLAAFSLNRQPENPVLLLIEETGGIFLHRRVDHESVNVSWTTTEGDVRESWRVGEINELSGTKFRLVKLGTSDDVVGFAHFIRVSPAANLMNIPEEARGVYKYEAPAEDDRK